MPIVHGAEVTLILGLGLLFHYRFRSRLAGEMWLVHIAYLFIFWATWSEVTVFSRGYVSGYFLDAVCFFGAVLLTIGGKQQDASRFVAILYAALLVTSGSVLAQAIGLPVSHLFQGAIQSFHAGKVLRASGIAYSPIPASECAVMAAGLALGYIAEQGRFWWAHVFAYGVAVLAIFLTVTRGSELALVVISGLAIFHMRKDRVKMGAVAACWLLPLLNGRFLAASGTRWDVAARGDLSVDARFRAWMHLPGIILRHPLGGVQNNPEVLSRLDGNGALNFFGQLALVGGIPLMLVAVVIVGGGMAGLLGILKKGIRGFALGIGLAFLGEMVAEISTEPFPYYLHTPALWAVLGLAVSSTEVIENSKKLV